MVSTKQIDTVLPEFKIFIFNSFNNPKFRTILIFTIFFTDVADVNKYI